MGKIRTFRHPVQPLSNDRISILIAERGALGYGAYWMIIEALHREPSLQLPYTDTQIRKLSAHTGIALREFGQLLQDLVQVYGLLVAADGQLSSPILYRRPRKAVALAPAPIATRPQPDDMPPIPASMRKKAPVPVPVAATDDKPKVDEFPMPPIYDLTLLRAQERIKRYITAKAPRVEDMQVPFTLDERVALCEAHDESYICNILDVMQADARLTKRFVSAYEAFRHFAPATTRRE
ncbi:MAG: DUF4373 domain-containing protein [Chitinophagaceae bacterium]|nr:MAG: DUF4373 domain-containing protein [Chitinophagaceae bacterium]